MERVNYVQSVGQLGVRRMNSAQETTFERELHERSRTAADPEAIENEWRRHCDNKCPEYLSRLFGYGRVLSAINRRTRFKQKTLRAGRLAVLLNLVRCESHNEALVSILETLLAEKASEAKDRRADGL